MKFGVLGTLQVIAGNSGEPRAVLAARLRALLAVLLWRANQPVPADELAELVWDGAPPGRASEATRALVMRLRQGLGERAAARIVTRAPGYLIKISGDELDASQFETLTREAGAAVSAGRWAQAARTASQALGLWRGTPLTDIPSQLLRDQWVPHLDQLQGQALDWRIEADLHDGRHEQLIPELQDLTGRHPLREHVHGQLMLALYRCGRQAEALAAYQDAREVLVTELGVDPGPGLRDLHRRILSADPALTVTGPARAAVAEPERVTPRELPPAVPGFTGRSAELDALTGLLDQPGQHDAETIVISAIGGTAGVGKTALAVHWAHHVTGRFPDGQLFADLRGQDPGPLPAMDALAGFLRSLGVPGQDIPPDEAGRASRYRSLLAGRRLLVVLDNAGSADQVRPLLPGTPTCTVLVTSRDALAGLTARNGAARLYLDLLPLDDAVGLLRTLIGARTDAEPAAAAELARQCGRLPLALRTAAELTAARPAMSLAELTAKLADLCTRRDLRTALDDLQQQILTGDPASGSPHDPGPAVTVCRASGMATASAVDVRFSLPPDSAAFTGREAELDRIMATVLDRAKVSGVVAIYAIGGMPGVGKTALALHAAHVLRDQFPGRCLFIDLHAHTLGHDPISPQAALAGLLTAAGVDARNLPADVEGRAALWRDKMAGQRALLVLDNAASSRQVVPLLPGGDGCLVLVTSRRHLADLPGAATPLLLTTLPPAEARDMFAGLAPRAAADPDEAVAELIGLAGYLPLAISLLARVYARHPSWTLADLVTETKASLLSLTAEDDSVAAAFEVSYRHLDSVQQQFFTLLGLHPGTTTDGYAAAALAGIGLAEATRLLDGLHREGLLTETGHRRYGMHDLLRCYARDHGTTLPGPASELAVGRLLDYYQYTAARAGVHLSRQIRLGALPAEPAVPPAAPDVDDADRALAWAQAERANLLDCLDHVTQAGHHARVIALTAALAALLRYDGPWADAIARHTTALQAAQRLGDRLGQARALNDLGDVRRLTDDFQGAAQAQEQALSIYRDVGDRLGQASTLYHLGAVRGATGDYLVTAQNLEQALGIYRDLGSQLGQASTLNYLGNARQMTADYPGAAQAQEQALSIYRDVGDRLGQADTLTYLGGVRRLTGDYSGAAEVQEQALSIFRDLGDRLGQANTLTQLGELRRMTGDYPGAAQAQEQALSIYRDLGARLGQANALLRIGALGRVTGDPGAAQALERALGIYRDLGVRDGEAEALNETGTLHRVTGNLAQAQGCHHQALELARAIANSWSEAHALAGLGRCALAAADLTTALASLGQAAEIFQQIGAAEASLMATELATLPRAEPAAQKP